MKLTAWNCQMAFRKDYLNFRNSIGPDIAVITECEDEERLKNRVTFKEIIWKGMNANKGIGIFSFSDNYHLTLHDHYNEDIKDVIPVAVTGKHNFTLFACWAKKELYYIHGITNSLEEYMGSISGDILIAGDLNANQIWRGDEDPDYTKFIGILEKEGIRSCYHEWCKEEHGKETRNTHYFRRDPDRGFHIDYCLASQNLLNCLAHVEIPEYGTWIEYSDHVPLSVIFS